jgi:hypothetical protein
MVDFTLANTDDIIEINKKINNKLPINTVFMCGKENGKVIMWFAFAIYESEVEILDLKAEANNDKLLYFCGKSGLNALDLSGFRNIFSTNEDLDEILVKLKFKKNKKIYKLTITDDYFKAGCCSNKE